MSNARWEQIKQVFNAAMEKPAAERSALVVQACAGDAELQREVESLLAAARPTLEPGPVQTGGAAHAMASATTSPLAFVPLTERVGTPVGPYKLLQVIGEGGFGTVFMADQMSPVRRRVALKIIKLGMDTRTVVARFEAERQALALMDHPNIAKVFDGGSTDSGRPFFVMEYVKGDPITLFADAHRLTLRERLQLLTQVCLAVQHAHQKGVIHRDIKPSNVLVSMVDGKPLAKVIDFGIAKATGAAGGALTDKTLFTEHRQLIGTPEYMSPEQAQGNPDIDTRTDVYGLGVLLYELLTGTTPFEPSRLRSAAYAEMQRIIKEEEPPTPSLRITRDVQRDLGKLAATAAQRQVEPQKLNALMRGELDWIVMKALDKDRARRFATPQDLAADIDRHLRGEAVVAAPPSAGYRVRKFVRRNKGAVVTGTAIAATLLMGIAATTWQWQRAETATEVAVSNEQSAREAEKAESEQRRIATAQAQRAEEEAKLATLAAEKEREAREDAQRRAVQAEERGRFALAQHLSEHAPTESALVLRELGPDQQSVSEAQMYDLARRSAPWVQVLGGHEGRVTSAAWSPDGTRIVTTGDDNTVRIWRVDGTVEPIIMQWHEEVVWHASWSPDGTRIVTTSDGIILIWQADGTGEPIVLRGPEGPVRQGAWSPDGTQIVTASRDNTARIWDADGSGEPIVLRGHEDWITHAEWSPDGMRIVTASADKTARIWSADGTGEPIVLRGHGNHVSHATWSPDGTRIITTSGESVQIWQADGTGVPIVLRGHENGITSVEWSSDGTRIVTASHDGTSRVWNADGTHEPIVFSMRKGTVSSAAWSPDDTRIVTASADRTVRIWNADGTGEPIVHSRHAKWVTEAAWSPDGQHVLTLDIEGVVLVWHADGGGEPLVFHRGEDHVCAAMSPQGTRIVTTSSQSNNTAWVRNTDGTGKPVPLLGHMEKIRDAAWSPDGTHIVTASMDKTARIWNADGSGEPIVLRGHGDWITHAEWSPDGTRIVTASSDKTARIWNADGTGEPIVLRGHENFVSYASWSPDGTRVVTASSDKTARIWSADGTSEPVLFRVHEGTIWHAAWSPDSTRVVMASANGPAQILRADGKGDPILLRGLHGYVDHAAWSPEGTRIVTTSYLIAQIWQADGTGEPIVLGRGFGEFGFAAWSPDGTRIVTAGSDTSFDATVWSADGTGEAIVLRGERSYITHAAWSQDGTRILTTASNQLDTPACIWTPNWPFQRRRIWKSGGILSVDDRVRLLGEDRPVAEARFAQDQAYYAELRTARRDGKPLPEPPVRERSSP